MNADLIDEILGYPSCPINSRRRLPSQPAVYFLLRGSRCLYVGKSICLKTRWSAHEKLAELEETADLRLAWIPAPIQQLDIIERKMIRELCPPFNKMLMPKVQPPLSAEYDQRRGVILKVREVAESQGFRNAFELSKATKIPCASTYKLWNATATRLDLDTLDKLCEVLKTNLDQLLDYAPSIPEEQQHVAALP